MSTECADTYEKPFVPQRLYATLLEVVNGEASVVAQPSVPTDHPVAPSVSNQAKIDVSGPIRQPVALPLDKVHFDQLATFAEDDPEFLTSMLKVFLEDVPEYLEQLRGRPWFREIGHPSKKAYIL